MKVTKMLFGVGGQGSLRKYTIVPSNLRENLNEHKGCYANLTKSFVLIWGINEIIIKVLRS